MNTRIQVEHPITEMVTAIDLVKTQIEVAAGYPLRFRQADVAQRGHAIECRIYAEDPSQNFFPSPGKIEFLHVPGGFGIRDDSGVYDGYQVTVFYDPLLAKLIAWGNTREDAIQRMLRALAEYRVHGVVTNIAFHRWVLQHPVFRSGEYDTNFIPQHYRGLADAENTGALTAALIAATLDARRRDTTRAGTLRPASAAGRASSWKAAGWREAFRS
jgi:acetyl-CoA carboxylase biotin carboxylase subunit